MKYSCLLEKIIPQRNSTFSLGWLRLQRRQPFTTMMIMVMSMRMILKGKELKMNDERAEKTPQGGDDRKNSCLGKLPAPELLTSAPKLFAVHNSCVAAPALH